MAPDWLCEVLSPSTQKIDRARKLRIYAREGVRHVWLVDPALRMLEVLRLGASGEWLRAGDYGDDEVVRAEPFEAIEFALSDLWASIGPRSNAQT
jgi:Uma2 family endonuclease